MVPEGFIENGLSQETLVFVCLVAFITVVFVAAIILSISDGGDLPPFQLGLSGLVVIGGAVACLLAIAGPVDKTYSRSYLVETHIESATAGSDHVAVTIPELNQPVEVKGGSAAGLVGRDVTLECEILWHSGAEDSYRCDLVSVD